RRRHTRWPRDWSSDVCSSDLSERAFIFARRLGEVPMGVPSPISEGSDVCLQIAAAQQTCGQIDDRSELCFQLVLPSALGELDPEIGRASCRERGWITWGRVYL